MPAFGRNRMIISAASAHRAESAHCFRKIFASCVEVADSDSKAAEVRAKTCEHQKMGYIRRTIVLLTNLGLWTSGVAVLFMIFLITLEVAGRRLFGFSTLVADEFSGYLLVVTTFMGGAYTLKMKGFTRMEAIYNRFKGGSRWMIDLAFNLVSLVFLMIVDYWLWVHILTSYGSGLTSISIFQTPLYIPQLFMGIGVTFLVFQVILEIAALFLPRRTDPIVEV
jgi:TRAP-type transport system small permease protein